MSFKIDLWFPTPIYVADDILSDLENEKIFNHFTQVSDKVKSGGSNWLSKPYNTMGVYDLRESEVYNTLLETVTEHVNTFASEYNTTDYFKCKNSWGNISHAGEYQEYHIHSHSSFSAVYYCKCPIQSGDIVFENPFLDMMEIQNIKSHNNLTYQNCSYPAKEKRLIIFRSHLKHMVKPGNNQSPRISFAFNYYPALGSGSSS